MAGFMNAELEAIRDNLVCGQCKSVFQGTDSQARKVKYEKFTVYCTPTCRKAAHSIKAAEQAVREGKTPRKGALFGPCPTCLQMFESRYSKLYCSLACYNKSPEFIERARAQISTHAAREASAKAHRRGQDVPCEECRTSFYQKQPAKGKPVRRFCGRPCYRAYLAKRFDRWIANPQRLGLLQNYDEFLGQDELPCLIEECDWHGKHLSLHMNQAHGVTADEFKRAAGFNLGTGVIARPLAQALSKRENVGVGIAGFLSEDPLTGAREKLATLRINRVQGYVSRERRERASKVRLLLGSGPRRVCLHCSCTFEQSTPTGRALYCSKACRQAAYARKRSPEPMTRTHAKDGTFIWVRPKKSA